MTPGSMGSRSGTDSTQPLPRVPSTATQRVRWISFGPVRSLPSAEPNPAPLDDGSLRALLLDSIDCWGGAPVAVAGIAARVACTAASRRSRLSTPSEQAKINFLDAISHADLASIKTMLMLSIPEGVRLDTGLDTKGTTALMFAARTGREDLARFLLSDEVIAILHGPVDLSVRDVHGRTAADIALAAAMNWPMLAVTRQPRVALLSTGDELQHPGEPLGPAQIIASNGIGLAAFVAACGGTPINLGIARDNLPDLHRALDGARGADVLVTTGGASVGELDLIQQALKDKGAKLDFWKIAMRPGKPVMFGTIGALPVLGLPGNPVSALVTATLFLRPIIQRLLGQNGIETAPAFARLGTALKANDQRQDYLRATLARGADGGLVATPFPKQDSAMLSLIAKADALIIRPPHAPAASEGDITEILPLSGGCLSI